MEASHHETNTAHHATLRTAKKKRGIVSTIAIATIYYNQSPALIVHIILCTEPHVGMG